MGEWTSKVLPVLDFMAKIHRLIFVFTCKGAWVGANLVFARNRIQIVFEGLKRAITRIAPTYALLQWITNFDGGFWKTGRVDEKKNLYYYYP